MMILIEVGLYTLFEALSIVFCLHYLYGEKPRFDILTLGYVVSEIILMEIIYFFDIEHAWSMLIYPILIAFCVFKFDFSFKSLFINIILNIIIIGILQTTIMLVFATVFQDPRLDPLENLLINFLMYIIVLLGVRRCKLDKISSILQSNEKIVVFSLSIVVICTILFIISYKHNKGFEIFYYVVLSVSLILILIAVLDIGKHKIRMKEAEAELRLHRLYEKSFQNLIDDICAKQHEFDNHINAIYSQHFLYKTYDELVQAQKKYCLEIINENHYNKLLSKGNPIILGFLYGKFLEMEKRKICVSYKISIENLKGKVPIYKIVELVGNLINNAMDAVEKQETNKIYVMMLEEKDKIQIEVSNEGGKIDYKEVQNFFEKGYSEKGKNRGYGLYNVKKICEEYKIVIVCENRNIQNRNWLTFILTINKPL